MSPSLVLIDSKSVRTSHHIDSSEYGIDGGKKVKGRKEHIIVDILGLPMAVKVHAASIHDSVGAVQPIKQLRHIFQRLKKIIADGGYRGKLVDIVKDLVFPKAPLMRNAITYRSIEFVNLSYSQSTSHTLS